MKRRITIFILVIFAAITSSTGQPNGKTQFDFYGEMVQFAYTKQVSDMEIIISQSALHSFYNKISPSDYEPVIEALRLYRESQKPDDWLFYQLVRKTAQSISPKRSNYQRYTFYKWMLMTRSGYDVILTVSDQRILFYVRCDENIYNIPNRIEKGKQYVCLNYHDYGNIDFTSEQFALVDIPYPASGKSFSYKISRLPDFKSSNYLEKNLRFNYNELDYNFPVKLNAEIKSIFANYPVVDYESYLNIPLSGETYQSLIPLLKKNVKGLNLRNGIDYLMRFTRYAFMFEEDSNHFGTEKRLSPEQTLLYDQSDCEDRVALFYMLVKEIYNLPMIVLSYPDHVTIAVQFDKPIGKPILYNGKAYSVCEPTPQKTDLPIGATLPELEHLPYEVVYAYAPGSR